MMAVLKPCQFTPIFFPPMTLLPEFRRLDKGEEYLNGTGSVHFLTDDGFHLSNGSKAQGEVGIDPGSQFPDHPRPKHQLMAGDFCFRRNLLQGR
jgi:hypothetical protein